MLQSLFELLVKFIIAHLNEIPDIQHKVDLIPNELLQKVMKEYFASHCAYDFKSLLSSNLIDLHLERPVDMNAVFEKCKQIQKLTLGPFPFPPEFFDSIPQMISLREIDFSEAYRGRKNITLPSEIFVKLTNLQYLNISYARMTSARSISFPVAIQDSLLHLYMDFSGLTHFPLNFRKLVKLKSLSLMGNRINMIPVWIDSLVALEFLNISNNCLRSIPSEMGNLFHLKDLNLRGNPELSYIPSSFSKLSSLVKLQIVENNTSSNMLTFLKHLSYLEDLSLGGDRLSEFPSEVIQLPQLLYLSIGKNNIETIPHEVVLLTSLKRLILEDNNLIWLPENIGDLTSLLSLNLSKNKITEFPASFAKLGLRILVLNQNGFDEFPKELANMRKLRILSLALNKIGIVPPTIRNMEELQFLNLHNCQLKNLPEEIKYLSQLRVLELSTNSISRLPSEITCLQQLNYISLSFNSISVFPVEVCELKQLQTLKLENNEIKNIPKEIADLKKLQELYLKQNVPPPTLPEDLKGMTSLAYLHLPDNAKLPIYLIPYFTQLGGHMIYKHIDSNEARQKFLFSFSYIEFENQ